MKFYLTGFMAIVVLASIGCKKSDTLDTDMNLSGIKVYDDTLASNENSSIRIASAADRIYMTYGLGIEAFYLSDYEKRPAITKLNALDSEGKLIWQKTLPRDIQIEDVLAFDDGGCLLAGTNPLVLSYINFYRYDRNGNMILADSVAVPVIDFAYTVSGSFSLMHAANGNILVYGISYDGGVRQGFATEFDMNLNLVWTQFYPSIGFLKGCALTPEGGYLFAGYNDEGFNGNTQNASLFLLKTNASGDTVWTKHFASKERLYCTGFDALANGNYCLSYTNSINSGMNYIGIEETYIMEVNAAGDSLNSARIDIFSNNKYNMSLIGLENGGVFALMGSVFLPVTSSTIWNQRNSSAVILNNDLAPSVTGYFQKETNDLLYDVCQTADGRIACAGLIQTSGKTYYKPCIIFNN